MRCPFCNHAKTKVVDKREIAKLNANRRRRECLKCKRRFTTYERLQCQGFVVVKRDNRREPFDRKKLITGLMKACEKRPVSQDKIEEIASSIENRLLTKGRKEIKSSTIGEMVMRALRKLDAIAYIRFASVYREFGNIDTFEEELKKLKK